MKKALSSLLVVLLFLLCSVMYGGHWSAKDPGDAGIDSIGVIQAFDPGDAGIG